MIKKFLVTTSLTFFLTSGLAFAQTASPAPAKPGKAEVAKCMKEATAKKNAAFRATKNIRKATDAKARADRKAATDRRVAKEAVRQAARDAKEAYNAAIKTAKEAFQADRQKCVSAAPRAEKPGKPETKVELLPLNQSGVSGKAELEEKDGKVMVKVELKGKPSDLVRPAHIHMGSCAALGAVKYPLTNIVGGKSETTISATLAQLKSELPLAVNVHKSEAEAGVYVACGDIKL